MTTTSKAEVNRVGFVLPGDPVPAPRPRIRVLRLANGKSMGVAYYTGAYKTYVVEAPKAIPESPIKFEKGTRLHVDVTFNCKRPLKPANPYPKSDIDNYVKSILDAITKNGTYWHDDVQVASLSARKVYSLIPRTDVVITGVPE